MSARGSTRPGVRAALPGTGYEVRSAVYRSPGGSVCVDFEGEDGRSRTFDFADCELPGWHEDLAVAVAARIGPGGGLRTTSSALAMWNPLQRFLRTLAGVDDVPRRPEQTRVEHAEYFADSVAATMQELYARRFVEQWPMPSWTPSRPHSKPTVVSPTARAGPRSSPTVSSPRRAPRRAPGPAAGTPRTIR
ncbi:hypothetical protein OG735_01810 [Streptomyces sp. NBC_01210]|uniref:hypothetical protein n=1 Tax=Streptomyces sp. NBC_01210 TaxID=2903774 RepID=UPI002E0F896B|nr:hypothetical protein OG735_01810 [Streptomyces sp. NBC_01210]